MKVAHKNEWWALMKRDQTIDAAGEWVRWPVGSIYLFVSVFNKKVIYNDKKIEFYKKKVILFSALFLIDFIIFLSIAIMFPIIP